MSLVRLSLSIHTILFTFFIYIFSPSLSHIQSFFSLSLSLCLRLRLRLRLRPPGPQAVLSGIPSIALDYVSPTHPVSCHDLRDLKAAVVEGTACRPDRTQWLANVGYAMWNVDDIMNGNVYRYLFNEGGPQRLGQAEGEFAFSAYEYPAR